MYKVIRQNLPDMTEKLLIGKINHNLINKQTIRFYFHFYNKPVHSDKLVRVTTLVEPVRMPMFYMELLPLDQMESKIRK